MPTYLHALIAAFLFAIVHGFHFTVGPESGVTVQVSAQQTPAAGIYSDIVQDDTRFAINNYRQ
jgi:hypothetical protein